MVAASVCFSEAISIKLTLPDTDYPSAHLQSPPLANTEANYISCACFAVSHTDSTSVSPGALKLSEKIMPLLSSFLSYLGHWLCAVISFSASSSNSHLPTPQTNTRGLWQKGFQFNFMLFFKNFSFPLSPSDWQLCADLWHFRFSSAGWSTVRVYMISLPNKKNSPKVGSFSIRLRLSFVIASLSHSLLTFTGAGLSLAKTIISYFIFVNNDRGQLERVWAQRKPDCC